MKEGLYLVNDIEIIFSLVRVKHLKKDHWLAYSLDTIKDHELICHAIDNENYFYIGELWKRKSKCIATLLRMD